MENAGVNGTEVATVNLRRGLLDCGGRLLRRVDLLQVLERPIPVAHGHIVALRSYSLSSGRSSPHHDEPVTHRTR